MFPGLRTEELFVTSVKAIEYIVIAYTENTVAPKMLFRLNSNPPAMSCAVAPKNKIHGIIKDFDGALETSCKSTAPSTKAATARPINPRAAGSARGTDFIVTSGTIVFVFSDGIISFFWTNGYHFSQYFFSEQGGCSSVP